MPWQPWWPGTTAASAALAADRDGGPEDAAEQFLRRCWATSGGRGCPSGSARTAGPRGCPRRRDGRPQARAPWRPEDVTVPVVGGHGTQSRPHHPPACGGWSSRSGGRADGGRGRRSRGAPQPPPRLRRARRADDRARPSPPANEQGIRSPGAATLPQSNHGGDWTGRSLPSGRVRRPPREPLRRRPADHGARPEPAAALKALAAALAAPDDQRRAAVASVVARWPRCLVAWATFGDLGRDDVESYACYRVGYHRGLDRLRANGWRGTGYVRGYPENQGFLRSLQGLARTAAAIGEADEAERCAVFLAQCDPDEPRGVMAMRHSSRLISRLWKWGSGVGPAPLTGVAANRGRHRSDDEAPDMDQSAFAPTTRTVGSFCLSAATAGAAIAAVVSTASSALSGVGGSWPVRTPPLHQRHADDQTGHPEHQVDLQRLHQTTPHCVPHGCPPCAQVGQHLVGHSFCRETVLGAGPSPLPSSRACWL